MREAEIAQPLSSVPVRWGGLTTSQLVWLAAASALPYLLLRVHLDLGLLLALSLPWCLGATALGFGRCEGRPLDAWIGDLLAFRVQPRVLRHPGQGAGSEQGGLFVEVDRDREPPSAAPPGGSLRWARR